MPHTVPSLSSRVLGLAAAATLLWSGAAFAQSVAPNRTPDFERIAPDLPKAPSPLERLPAPKDQPPLPAGDKVLVPALRGLVFVGQAAEIVKSGAREDGVRVPAGSLLDNPEFRLAMAPYLGQPLTLDRLNEIARRTVLFYREQDRPLVDVIVPEQNITTGTVQVVALEFVVGDISAEGNQWFSDDQLLAGVRVSRGDRVSGQQLLDDINWLNENPFRHTDLVYQRGRRPGESDIILRTEDRFPVRVFGGTENTGTATTSRNRIFSGFNWGNAFWAGHQLSYQYTVSPDTALHPGSGRYFAHAITYQVPLPWRDTLTVFGSYSKSRPKLPDLFRQEGESGQASVRYTVRLPTWEGLRHSIDIGADFKRSNNNLDYGGTVITDGMTDVAQGVLGYTGSRKDGWGDTALSVNLFVSPGGLGGNNTTHAYRPTSDRAGRDFAEARYAYLRAELQRRFTLPEDFSWITRIKGQLSSANLLSSEQLLAGGADSIRGYEESEAAGDRGILISNELRTPELPLSEMLGVPGVNDTLQVLVFWDYGHVANKRVPEGDKGHWTLSSVGAGLRYTLFPYLAAKLDWGHALPETGQGYANSEHIHFGLTLAF